MTVCHDILVVDISEEDWERMMDLDLKAVYLACKYAIPEMRVERWLGTPGVLERVIACHPMGRIGKPGEGPRRWPFSPRMRLLSSPARY